MLTAAAWAMVAAAFVALLLAWGWHKPSPPQDDSDFVDSGVPDDDQWATTVPQGDDGGRGGA